MRLLLRKSPSYVLNGREFSIIRVNDGLRFYCIRSKKIVYTEQYYNLQRPKSSFETYREYAEIKWSVSIRRNLYFPWRGGGVNYGDENYGCRIFTSYIAMNLIMHRVFLCPDYDDEFYLEYQ